MDELQVLALIDESMEMGVEQSLEFAYSVSAGQLQVIRR